MFWLNSHYIKNERLAKLTFILKHYKKFYKNYKYVRLFILTIIEVKYKDLINLVFFKIMFIDISTVCILEETHIF